MLHFRFLRHVPVVYVDYPGELSLTQIYGTFNRAMLRLVPSLKPYSDPLTSAMVEFYLMSQVWYTQHVLSTHLKAGIGQVLIQYSIVYVCNAVT